MLLEAGGFTCEIVWILFDKICDYFIHRGKKLTFQKIAKMNEADEERCKVQDQQHIKGGRPTNLTLVFLLIYYKFVWRSHYCDEGNLNQMQTEMNRQEVY